MPPRIHSRYSLCEMYRDSAGALVLTEYEPYGYREFADNRPHVVSEGDTLFNLAGRSFAPIPRPAGLYWVLADFQPEPIVDVTLRLRIGRTLIIPSVRTVLEEILSEERRAQTRVGF